MKVSEHPTNAESSECMHAFERALCGCRRDMKQSWYAAVDRGVANQLILVMTIRSLDITAVNVCNV